VKGGDNKKPSITGGFSFDSNEVIETGRGRGGGQIIGW